jgi:hypothetical protein
MRSVSTAVSGFADSSLPSALSPSNLGGIVLFEEAEFVRFYSLRPRIKDSESHTPKGLNQ